MRWGSKPHADSPRKRTRASRIEGEFGAEVAEIVKGVSEDKSQTWAERKRHTVTPLATSSFAVAVVCAADKFANIRDLARNHEANGHATWDRFNAPYSRQRRYYRALTGALETRTDRELLPEFCTGLRSVVDRLFPPDPVLDVRTLVQAVNDRTTSAWSSLHGERHWRQVAANGAALLEVEPLADPTVVFLFALLHDSCRENDGHDPDHGRRAATHARQLHAEGSLSIDADQLTVLCEACDGHADGYVRRDMGEAHDPTIGVCWDADRLDLPRVGITPNGDLLSSSVEDWRARIDGHDRNNTADWLTLHARYRKFL